MTYEPRWFTFITLKLPLNSQTFETHFGFMHPEGMKKFLPVTTSYPKKCLPMGSQWSLIMALHAMPSCPKNATRPLTLLQHRQSATGAACESARREQSERWLGSVALHVISFHHCCFTVCAVCAQHITHTAAGFREIRGLISQMWSRSDWTFCSY